MAANENRPGEDTLIERYFAPLAGPGGLNLRDDAALLVPPEGCELVTTVDMVVSGVHFFADDPPDAIAEKALGVNLSDLAAKGADPIGFLLAIALPSDWTEDWLAHFSQGLGAAAARGRCTLLGGDTTRASGPLIISVTAFGSVQRKNGAAHRCQARGSHCCNRYDWRCGVGVENSCHAGSRMGC